MTRTDHNDYRELLYLAPDGELTVAENARLQRHLPGCAECRDLRREIEELHELVASSKIAVAPDLSDRVLESLPPAGWETMRPASWGVAAALLLLLGATTVSVVVLGGGLSDAPLAGTAVALFEMLRSAVLAGSGMLAASWQGLGMAIEESLGGSPLSLAVFGLAVFGLDLLFLRFLFRVARARAVDRRS